MDRFYGRSGRIGAGLVVLGVLFVTTGFSLAAFAVPGNGNGDGNGDGNGGGNRIEICHFSGRAGSGVYETLTISANSNGHFHNNGTNRAGHETDYLGPCVEDDVDETEETTPTTTGDTTPTTTEGTTPTTTGDTTPTTTEGTTPTTVGSTEEDSTEATTTTTVADDSDSLGETPGTNDSTTTTVFDSDDESVIVPGEGEATTTSVSRDESDTADVEVETLPYTGPNTYLVVPGVILLLVGGIAVFLSHGFGGSGRIHMATEQAGISLGLHRGRHEG